MGFSTFADDLATEVWSKAGLLLGDLAPVIAVLVVLAVVGILISIFARLSGRGSSD